jgi:hypothetical protein
MAVPVRTTIDPSKHKGMRRENNIEKPFQIRVDVRVAGQEMNAAVFAGHSLARQRAR